METEKAIIRDVWIYLREHNDPPALGTDACTVFWERAAKDIGDMVGGKWKNHPLAMELGLAVYSYLEQKCKAKSPGRGGDRVTGYQALANGIIEQAVKDYRAALKTLAAAPGFQSGNGDSHGGGALLPLLLVCRPDRHRPGLPD